MANATFSHRRYQQGSSLLYTVQSYNYLGITTIDCYLNFGKFLQEKIV